MNPVIEKITKEIIERSKVSRAAYLNRMRNTQKNNPPKKRLSCGNLAHAFAACGQEDKERIAGQTTANIGIITAYNDMLSAHQPYKDYPDQIKEKICSMGGTAQVAGGVPAMCDGVTQGQAGMELSLFSRDLVAMSTCIGLTHNMFDASMFLGICDKIVPGMMMGALEFGHLPAVFVPAGPMATGMSNKDKAAQRQLYAEGKIDDNALLAVESASYHSPGTCTFYGTANSNQLLMELMGVQLAGSSFVQPNTELRKELTNVAVEVAAKNVAIGDDYRPLYDVVTEKSIVNAIVGLLATGGSTNHGMHIVAIARSAGIIVTWDDIDQLSDAVPLLAKVYPNGTADVNQFHSAGGMAFLVNQLRKGGYLNEDVVNIMGKGLDNYERTPELKDGKVVWDKVCDQSGDLSVLAYIEKPFAEDGGLKVLNGNLGKAMIKVSAVAEEHRVIEAPARVFHSQEALKAAFDAGELFQDVVAVVRFQGPTANGMPELHKMTPLLGICQDRGHKVALVTDGRMSGASGKVPAAIHVSPEALSGGLIAKIVDGDMIRVDAPKNELSLLVDEATLAARAIATDEKSELDLGRPLFEGFRALADIAERGAAVVNPMNIVD